MNRITINKIVLKRYELIDIIRNILLWERKKENEFNFNIKYNNNKNGEVGNKSTYVNS